jgi:hypothetical protein
MSEPDKTLPSSEVDSARQVRDYRRLGRRANVATGLAVAAIILGPAGGAASAIMMTEPGPTGRQGSPGEQGVRGPAGPQGPAGQLPSGTLVLADFSCPQGTSSSPSGDVVATPVNITTHVHDPGAPFPAVVNSFLDFTTYRVCRVR